MTLFDIKIWICLLFGSIGLVGQKNEINSLLSTSDLEHATVGISIREIASDTEIYGYNSEKLFTPASSLKLITTFTAYTELGPSFTFTTKVSHDGTLAADGTLDGNLYIIGGGDPTLGGKEERSAYTLEKWHKEVLLAIKKKGINCIDGDIISDATIYTGQHIPDQWAYNDIGNYYAGGAWGLNINENLYYLYFDNKKKLGAKPTIKYSKPTIINLKFTNELRIAGPNTGDQAYIYGVPKSYTKTLRGTLPQGKGTFSIKGAMPDPPLQAAQLLENYLSSNGIKVGGHARLAKASPNQSQLLTVDSPPLQQIIKEVNTHSLNLHAESLLRMLGKQTGTGSIKEGVEAVNLHIESLGLYTDEIVLRDGSGLSHTNKITPRLMTSFLSKKQKSIGKKILSILPRAGQRGTVKNLLRNNAISQHFYLKSGSFEGVQSYSGFMKGKSGKAYAVFFVVNNYTCSYSQMRGHLEKMMAAAWARY